MDYNILVNVKIKSQIQTNYEFKQQDFGQKLIIMAEDYDISGTTARLFINKRDGTVNERVMIKENDSYTYTLDAADTSCAGKTVFDVKYYKQGVRDSSASFIFNIIPDRFGNLIESKTMSDSLQSALDRVDKTKEIVDEYDEKIEQINNASARAENAATNSVIVVANCEQATNKANVATDRANTAAATAEGIAENKTGINDNAVGASTTWSSNKINTSLANQIGSASGASINLPNTFNGGLLLKELQGKSVQNGTPTPDAKVDIVSVGDNGSVIAKVTGKNVFPRTLFGVKTINGITFTPNSDGSITVNGTASAKADFALFGYWGATELLTVLPKGSYTLKGTGNANVSFHIANVTTSLVSASSSNAQLNLTEHTGVTYTMLRVDSGTTVSNLTVYPQLELGTTSTPYEPYKEQLVTIPLTQPLRSVGSVYDRGCVKVNGLWGNERKFVTKTFDGSADEWWTKSSLVVDGYTSFYLSIPTSLGSNTVEAKFINNIFQTKTYYDWTGLTKSEFIENINKSYGVRILSSRLATQDLAGFRAWLASNPLKVIYELETPVFEPYPQSLQDQLNKLQTYPGVTNVFTTDALQPALSVGYGKTDTSALSIYASNANDNKLDKTSVANNLITNVSGTVLGGEQGKILNDKIGNVSNLTTASKTDLVGSINEIGNNLNQFGLIPRGDVAHITEINNMGLYHITNLSEMPSSNPYTILSLGKKGREWNYPIVAFDNYGNGTYRGRLASSDGVTYTFDKWTNNFDSDFDSYTEGKKIVIFGDSYAEGSSSLSGKLGGLLGERMKESIFYDYSVGGACIGNFGTNHNLSSQYNDMVSANIIPDICMIMMGNNDANHQMQILVDGGTTNSVGIFDYTTTDSTTSIGNLKSVVEKILTLNPICKICVVPFFNLNQSSDGYFKLAATAIMTQLSIFSYWKNISILWQENFSNIDWNDTNYWLNSHPTRNFYIEIMQPIIVSWLRAGCMNNPYPRKEFGLITSSTYETTSYFNDICTKINKMRKIGANTISPNLCGDYSILSIGGSLDTVHVSMNSFYDNIYVEYKDSNGIKWVKYTTAGEITIKGINWA